LFDAFIAGHGKTRTRISWMQPAGKSKRTLNSRLIADGHFTKKHP